MESLQASTGVLPVGDSAFRRFTILHLSEFDDDTHFLMMQYLYLADIVCRLTLIINC